MRREETDWGTQREERGLFSRKKKEGREEEEGRMVQTEKKEKWWAKERKGVKERKWSERTWRGQVQWQSRWREGKREGEKEWWQGGNRESGEVNVSTVVWWGVSVSMPARFSTHSFKDLLFFPFPPVFSSFSFQASSFFALSQFLALSLADSIHCTGTTVHHREATNRLPKCNFDTTFFFYTLELQRMIWFESSGKVIRSHSCWELDGKMDKPLK